MRNRIRFEHELIHKLEQWGYGCFRAAGSRGPVDVFALHPAGIRFIQVKSTVDFDRKGNWSVFTEAVLYLHSFVKTNIPSVYELWVRELRTDWRFIDVSDAPREKGALRQFLQEGKWTHWDGHCEPPLPIFHNRRLAQARDYL